MILGLDFDNTIACYDSLFHALALERNLIPADLPTDKTAVRDFLRSANKEDDWTELQGLAYGPEITRAAPFPHVATTLQQLTAAGITLHIVSHKTKHPYRGKPHDLHAAARRFLEHHRLSPAIIPTDRVHLEPTKEKKLARIATLQCDAFLDDLPEFLAEPAFPKNTQAILFDPTHRAADPNTTPRITAWTQLPSMLGPAPRTLNKSPRRQ